MWKLISEILNSENVIEKCYELDIFKKKLETVIV